MRKLTFIGTFLFILGSCGTTQGLLNGASEVLNGMARDARAAGTLFN